MSAIVTAVRRVLTVSLAAVLSVLSVLSAGPTPVAVAQEPSQAGDAAQQLAERFAPILMLKQQDEDCDPDGEPYRPGLVDVVIGNPEVALRQVGGGDPVVMRGPDASQLAGLNQGFFLDFPGNSLSPGCLYERDFWKYTGDLPAAVYAHVVQQPDRPDVVFLQYWFYWYYNDWNNKHESDWEGITLLFEAGSVEEALSEQPAAVGYSQHEGGERADWEDAKLEREGDHPVVYPSAGSHASYFGSAVYLGRGASEGFGCDTTDGPSERVVPEVVVLPDAVDDPTDPLAWLAFNGRWGERQEGAFNGPTGPATKGRWLEPAPWFDTLRDSSVVIPAGDADGNSVVSLFCSAVERGSRALIKLKLEPARVMVGIALLALLAAFLVRRTRWDEVEPRPIRRRRRLGEILRAALLCYRRDPIVFVMFGLVYIPAAVLAAVLASVLRYVPLFGAFWDLLGGASGTNLLLTLLIGSLVNVAAFVIVNAAVAVHLERENHGFAAGRAAAAETWARRRDLARAFLWAYAVILVLLLTGVLAPIGVFLLVRYQFVPQTVMLEGLDGSAALRRSGSLVRRRWLHTAVVAAGLNGLVIATAAVVGLLMLLVFPDVPLQVLSVLTSLVYAVLVPLAAISMTLLYGDAVAEQQGAPRAERIVHLDEDAVEGEDGFVAAHPA